MANAKKKTTKRISLDNVILDARTDPEFEGHFERELLINKIANTIYACRNKAELTQSELAERSGTSQPVIARLESGNDSRVPSLDLLSRIAQATGKKLSLSFS